MNSSKECTKSFGPFDFPGPMSQVNAGNKVNANANIESLKEDWKDLQGDKSKTAHGLLNLETGLSGYNTDPFSQKK